MAGTPMPGLISTCPNCHRDCEQAVSMEALTDVYGRDGEESWQTDRGVVM